MKLLFVCGNSSTTLTMNAGDPDCLVPVRFWKDDGHIDGFLPFSTLLLDSTGRDFTRASDEGTLEARAFVQLFAVCLDAWIMIFYPPALPITETQNSSLPRLSEGVAARLSSHGLNKLSPSLI